MINIWRIKYQYIDIPHFLISADLSRRMNRVVKAREIIFYYLISEHASFRFLTEKII